MKYKHSKKYNRLAARRDDILAKDELTQDDQKELARIDRKLDSLPEAENYAGYIQNKLRRILARPIAAAF